MKTSTFLLPSAVLVLVCSICRGALSAEPVYTDPIPAVEVSARKGVGNFLEKVRAGKSVSVAYLGGSITAQGDARTGRGGWRVKTTKFLRETYPQAKIREINAAIGGTGSNLGVYRVGQDVLAANPDLLFVEFATNDGGDKGRPETIWRSMEGIVRQTWARNPKADIVFVYTITASMTNTYSKGYRPRAAGAQDMLADHYGIPSIDFGPRVWKAIAGQKLVISANEFATAVPADDPEHDRKVRELMVKDPRVIFSNDGVHPRDEGHDFYLASIKEGFAAVRDLKPVDHDLARMKPFVADNYEAAKLVDFTPDMFSGDWTKLPCGVRKYDDNFGFRHQLGSSIYLARKPGAKIAFRFRGRACQLYDLLGPDCGQINMTVDGVRRPDPVPRFDRYCTYYRLGQLSVFSGDDPNAVHTVELELDDKQPPRLGLDRQYAKDAKKGKFDGTSWIVGKIMLIGDLIADGASETPTTAGSSGSVASRRTSSCSSRCSTAGAKTPVTNSTNAAARTTAPSRNRPSISAAPSSASWYSANAGSDRHRLWSDGHPARTRSRVLW